MKKLLLHSCCAPCSTAVIEKLKENFYVTIFFTNSNIFPQKEFEKRLQEQKKYVNISNVKMIEDEYDEKEFLNFVKGFENCKENQERCTLCFEFRLMKTAEKAKKDKFDFFASTLSVSPHKNTIVINQIGEKCSQKYGVLFLAENFKKQDGFKKSVDLSKKYQLYRQDYCGCRFSMRKKVENV